MSLTFEDVRTEYLTALVRCKDALSRECDQVQVGGFSLQSTSDALCELRRTRQNYCAHRRDESDGSGRYESGG